ncbi:MAG: PQQ-dependent sugar dehydrogenase, partial [Planctomycetes bacterium]|nr:PQQ-dependent sugar dehydrogenase [Planctomycetota bacterium]
MMLLSLAALAGLVGGESDFYAVDYLAPPVNEVIEVGGMAFLDETTLLVSTRRGRVWWIDNALADNPTDAKFHIYAEGLHEGLGLAVRDGNIYVTQRGEVSRLVDLDGDHICDRVETISQDWGMSGNYHEFAFGLPIDDEGNFYVSTNVGFWSPEWWHGISKVEHRGWILRIAPDGHATPLAMGGRSPAGLGFDGDGHLLYSDNQGDWMPACGLFHVQEGAFFGHPASLRWTEGYGFGEEAPSSIDPPDVKRTGPAIWLPYEWSKSTGNFVPDQTGGQFGPFGGQLFVAELTQGMVLRAMLEEVNGKVQGAVVKFRQNIGSALRVEFASD